MSRKHVVKSFNMLSQADMSANILSGETNTLQLDKASIYLAWSGNSPVGTIRVEARNGAEAPWYDLELDGTPSVSGNTGSHVIVLNEMPFSDIRVAYDSTSGTGNLDAILTMKTVGA